MHITDIIKKPVATEKARNLANENNEYVFIVDRKANKIQIREAVEKLFNVKVESVNTLNIKPKAKRFRMSIYKTSALKKAMVKLYSMKIKEQTRKLAATARRCNRCGNRLQLGGYARPRYPTIVRPAGLHLGNVYRHDSGHRRA